MRSTRGLHEVYPPPNPPDPSNAPKTSHPYVRVSGGSEIVENEMGQRGMEVSGEGVNGVWVNGMRENGIGGITYLQYWCFLKRLQIHQNLDNIMLCYAMLCDVAVHYDIL